MLLSISDRIFKKKKKKTNFDEFYMNVVEIFEG